MNKQSPSTANDLPPHSKVLVTGAAGYIGSITVRALLRRGHRVVALDSLVSGHRDFVKEVPFYHGEVGDAAFLRQVFAEHPDIAATIHFAAFISVPESVERPTDYFFNNVAQSAILFQTLAELKQQRLIFSSSASLYDSPADGRVDEESPLKPSSPYARGKLTCEHLLEDISAISELRAISLRYFNPIGSDGQTGPYLPESGSLLGRLLHAQNSGEAFTITGTDHPTRDGTGIRDYVHVTDLAEAHVQALERFSLAFEAGQTHSVINLGSGNGVTVREFVAAYQNAARRFEIESGDRLTPLDVQDGPARPGDVTGAFADTTRAGQLLGWRAETPVEDSILSALHWNKAWQARKQQH